MRSGCSLLLALSSRRRSNLSTFALRVDGSRQKLQFAPAAYFTCFSTQRSIVRQSFFKKFPTIFSARRKSFGCGSSKFSSTHSIIDDDELPLDTPDGVEFMTQSTLDIDTPWLQDWHRAYERYVHENMLKGILEFDQRRQQQSLAPHEIIPSYSLAMMTSSHYNIEKALRFYEELISFNVGPPPEWVYETLMRECYRRGRILNAKELMSEAQKKLPSISSALHIVYLRFLGRMKLSQEAYDAYQMMLHGGAQPTEQNMNELLVAVRHDYPLSQKVITMMKQNGFQIQLKAIATLITVNAVAFRKDFAYQLYSQAVNEGMTLREFPLRALLNLARAANDHEKVLQLYDVLQGMTFPGMNTYTVALNAAMKLRRHQKVLAIQADAKASGLADDVFLKTALDASIMLRQWDRIPILFQEMLSVGLPQGQLRWYRLFATELLTKMSENEVVPMLLQLFEIEQKMTPKINRQMILNAAAVAQREQEHEDDDDGGGDTDDTRV